MTISDFAETPFTHDGKTRPVFTLGSGPAVVILHEIPGFTPDVADFGRRVAERKMTAVIPLLCGEAGRSSSTGYFIREMAKVCVSREFLMFAKNESAPVTDWLRALARRAHAEHGGPGIGAIGMCFSAGLILGMMVDPAIVAPVLSQPSRPLPTTAAARASLGLSPGELAIVKKRVANERIPMLGLRFTADGGCPPDRFKTLRQHFGDNFKAIEIDSGPGNAHGLPSSAHGVLTDQLRDAKGHPTRAALDAVLDMLSTQLLRTSRVESATASN
jgi:dienelactone hydrolase